MDLKHEKTQHKGRFYIVTNDNEVAEMTYSMAGESKMIIDHTEVNDRYKGQQLGLRLVTAAVEMARQEHMKILPLCPFAKAQFKKHPKWNDVLA